MSGTNTITLDGKVVAFSPGETLFEISQRHDRGVPTLCYDPRLEPFGGCRLCVVELEGAKNPVASCTQLRISAPYRGTWGSIRRATPTSNASVMTTAATTGRIHFSSLPNNRPITLQNASIAYIGTTSN